MTTTITTPSATIVSLLKSGDIERLKQYAQAHTPTRADLGEVKKQMGWYRPSPQQLHSKLADWMH
jgi:hypothetical protein